MSQSGNFLFVSLSLLALLRTRSRHNLTNVTPVCRQADFDRLSVTMFLTQHLKVNFFLSCFNSISDFRTKNQAGEKYMIINHWAVLVCAVFNMALGAMWYSPALFYNAWKKENNLTDELIKKGNPIKMYGASFFLAYVMSYNLA